jgi:hypothetical protein
MVFSAGWFDFIQQADQAAEFRFEIRIDKGFWNIKPLWGLTKTTDGASQAYIGIWMDLNLFGDSFVITPSFSPSFIYEGSGKTLYSPAEFKSQIEISYIFKGESRISVYLNHISNAGISKLNPGAETIGINYIIPVENVF